MTLTNTIVAKLAVAFVAISMVFFMVSPAKAQTAAELQATIDGLMAQIAALNAQIGGGVTVAATAGVCPYTWTRSLNNGATGADVMALQQFLNSSADTQVAPAGSAGGPGSETSYYGPATAAAVSNFQVKYRTDILSPVGLVNPTGYFGPSTMAKANMLCVAGSSTGDDTTGDDDDMSDDDDDDVTLRGEADLRTFSTDSASDDELEEGAEDAEIAEVTVEFDNGDAIISRIDLALEGTGDEQDPWDTFESISLWIDGDKVAEMNADDEDDYLDEDDGSLRFSGLDIVAMEDEEVEITVAATVQGSVDGTNDGEAWTVEFDSIRFFDADDVATTDNTTDDLGDATGESFTIVEAGADDELIVKTSSSDPDGTTLQLEDDSKSDWYTVFAFDLDTDDSVNDITVNEISVNVEVSSSTFALIVDDAELVIDGVTIDDYTASSTAGSAGATSTLTFDVDGDVEIDAGDRVTAELMLRFKSLAAGNEGITVQAEITSALADTIDAEGADDLSTSQISGAATGDDHTLRTQGVDVSLSDTDAVATSNAVGSNDDYATYTIELDVTAFEQDVYISTNPATSISYTLEDSAGSSSVTGARSITVTSTGDEVNNAFEITEGATETITVVVTYTPGVANTAARMQLNSIVFGSASGSPTGQTWTASPETTYRTSVVTIVD